MLDTSHLRPATSDEIADTFSFALRYEGRKRVHHVDDAMARITAGRLMRRLERGGFAVMKASPAAVPTTSHMPLQVPGRPID